MALRRCKQKPPNISKAGEAGIAAAEINE